jgi:hypothetical protein
MIMMMMMMMMMMMRSACEQHCLHNIARYYLQHALEK